MDKNTWIVFGLIAAIILAFSLWNRPSQEQLAERQRINDSIAVARQLEWEAQQLSAAIEADLQKAEEAQTSEEES